MNDGEPIVRLAASMFDLTATVSPALAIKGAAMAMAATDASGSPAETAAFPALLAGLAQAIDLPTPPETPEPLPLDGAALVSKPGGNGNAHGKILPPGTLPLPRKPAAEEEAASEDASTEGAEMPPSPEQATITLLPQTLAASVSPPVSPPPRDAAPRMADVRVTDVVVADVPARPTHVPVASSSQPETIVPAEKPLATDAPVVTSQANASSASSAAKPIDMVASPPANIPAPLLAANDGTSVALPSTEPTSAPKPLEAAATLLANMPAPALPTEKPAVATARSAKLAAPASPTNVMLAADIDTANSPALAMASAPVIEPLERKAAASLPATDVLPSPRPTEPSFVATPQDVRTPALALTVPAPAASAAPTQDLAALVDRITEARAAAAPHTVRAALVHEDFGSVSLNFRAEQSHIHVTLGSADPAFAPAVHAAAAASMTANTGGEPDRRDPPSLHQTADTAAQTSTSSQQQPSQDRAAAGERATLRRPSPERTSPDTPEHTQGRSAPQRRSGFYA